MAIYVKFGSIKGEATQESHKEWMDVQSMQFGIGRAISTPVGSAANREASHPSISEVTMTKLMDGASYKLFEEACIGKKGEKCEIHLVSNENEVYAEYVLENAMISGYSASSGGDRPNESISINFTKITYKYTPFGADHKQGTPVTAGYDIATAKKV